MTRLSPTLSPTERTQVRRAKERARSDREALYDVLDSGLICHLGLVVDGSPVVLPTGYGRIGDTLYVHGSTGAMSLRSAPDREVCVTVTHVDGVVLARSVFHHSMNYRSAVIFGTARQVDGDAERLEALRAITERLAPGQWDYVRGPTAKELAKTSVIAIPLAEASVKVRQGPPKDDDEDYALPLWAGVQPLRVTWGDPVSDPRLNDQIAIPAHIAGRTHVISTM